MKNTNNKEYFQGELLKDGATDILFITPQMFGAKGDGRTDDTLAFNKALEATSLSTGSNMYGRTVTIPPAQYLICGAINMFHGASLVGKEDSILIFDASNGTEPSINLSSFNLVDGFTVDITRLKSSKKYADQTEYVPEHRVFDIGNFDRGFLSAAAAGSSINIRNIHFKSDQSYRYVDLIYMHLGDVIKKDGSGNPIIDKWGNNVPVCTSQYGIDIRNLYCSGSCGTVFHGKFFYRRHYEWNTWCTYLSISDVWANSLKHIMLNSEDLYDLSGEKGDIVYAQSTGWGNVLLTNINGQAGIYGANLRNAIYIDSLANVTVDEVGFADFSGPKLDERTKENAYYSIVTPKYVVYSADRDADNEPTESAVLQDAYCGFSILRQTYKFSGDIKDQYTIYCGGFDFDMTEFTQHILRTNNLYGSLVGSFYGFDCPKPPLFSAIVPITNGLLGGKDNPKSDIGTKNEGIGSANGIAFTGSYLDQYFRNCQFSIVSNNHTQFSETNPGQYRLFVHFKEPSSSEKGYTDSLYRIYTSGGIPAYEDKYFTSWGMPIQLHNASVVYNTTLHKPLWYYKDENDEFGKWYDSMGNVVYETTSTTI